MVSNKLLKQLWAIAPPAFDSGRRPWELGLPAICRAPAVESDGSVGQVHSIHRVCWRFTPDRRQGGAPPRQTPTPFGLKRSTSIAPRAFDSGRRPWELGLPAICRAPAVEPDAAGLSDASHPQGSLPVPGRSSASQTPTPAAEARPHLPFDDRPNALRGNAAFDTPPMTTGMPMIV